MFTTTPVSANRSVSIDPNARRKVTGEHPVEAGTKRAGGCWCSGWGRVAGVNVVARREVIRPVKTIARRTSTRSVTGMTQHPAGACRRVDLGLSAPGDRERGSRKRVSMPRRHGIG